MPSVLGSMVRRKRRSTAAGLSFLGGSFTGEGSRLRFPEPGVFTLSVFRAGDFAGVLGEALDFAGIGEGLGELECVALGDLRPDGAGVPEPNGFFLWGSQSAHGLGATYTLPFATFAAFLPGCRLHWGLVLLLWHL